MKKSDFPDTWIQRVLRYLLGGQSSRDILIWYQKVYRFL